MRRQGENTRQVVFFRGVLFLGKITDWNVHSIILFLALLFTIPIIIIIIIIITAAAIFTFRHDVKIERLDVVI